MSRWGNPANGRVVLAIWDGWEVSYSTLWATARLAGWPIVAGIGIAYTQNNTPGRLSEEQCREMGTTGACDVCTHFLAAGNDYSDPGWTAETVAANWQLCLDYLEGLRVRGANILAPSGGLSEMTWGVAQGMFDWIVWDTDTGYVRYPQDPRFTVTWCGCADNNEWSSITAKLDLVTGNPRQVVVASFHRIITVGDATTVDQDSSSGQKVLYVASTTPFEHGNYIDINEAGPRYELRRVNTVQDGVSLTLTENLTYTHTQLQADEVKINVHGTQVSEGRMMAVLNYVAALDCTVCTFSQMRDLVMVTA